MMNYTYIVKCADGTLYTGWTNCLQKRMKAHNEGKNGAKYTRTKRPVTLVYYEGFSTKEEAMRREYEIKQFTRNQKTGVAELLNPSDKENKRKCKKMTKWLAVCAVCVMGSVPAMAAEVPDVTVTPIPIETPAPDVTPIETPATNTHTGGGKMAGVSMEQKNKK